MVTPPTATLAVRTAMLAGLLLLAALPAGAADRVAFRTQTGEVVVSDLEGDQRRVVQVGADRLAWSPDGSQIAYTDAQGVWFMAADVDAPPRLVAEDPQAWSVDFSPDGSYLAYDRPGADRSGIVVVTLFDDGYSFGTPYEVTNPQAGAVDIDPQWAPDGGTIAYRRHDLRTRYVDLQVIDLPLDYPDGAYTERVLLDQTDYLTLSAPSWAPDGTHLLIEAIPRLGQVGTPRQLYRVDRHGGTVQGLVTGEQFQPALPAMSPDGRHIAYVRVCTGECTGNELEGSPEGGVWVLDTATGASTQIADTSGFERDLSWTADATQVVFESAHDDSGCHCDISDLYAASVERDAALTQHETFQVGPLGPAVSPGVTQRLSGPSRIETAVAISRATFDDAAVVVLARADAYADALAGAPLAGRDGGPLLLSPSSHLPESVRREILRLGAARVVLLGDETALSEGVERQLLDMAENGDIDVVERIGGATRFDTAALVAEHLPADHAFVVQGAAADPARGWPDAVAVAGLAAAQAQPLLLVEQDRLPAETARAITDGTLTSVTIVGGPAAVSDAVEQAIRDLGVTVDRLAGATRYETSVAVARRSIELGADGGLVAFATGRNWPDTLAAGPAAAHRGGVVLLVDGHDPAGSPATLAHLDQHPPVRGWIAGGPDVVTPSVRVAIERRVR